MKSPEHILILRFSAMGDVAIMVPLLRVLFDSNPSLRMTLVSRPSFKPIFKEFDRLDFFAIDTNDKHKGIFGIWKLFNELKGLQPTSIADLHSVLRTHILVLFFRIFGFRVARIQKGRKEKKALTRAKNKVFVQLKTTLERYADVFRKLGFELSIPESIQKETNRKKLPLSLRENLPSDDLKWIGIAPFASYTGKTYPKILMKEVVKELAQSCHILLFGAPGDEAEELSSWTNLSDKVCLMTNLGSLTNELLVIEQLDLMISMDSANGHLAANFGIPVLSIWGLTHPYAGFAPFSQSGSHNISADRGQYPLIPTSIYGNKVPDGYEHAMESITVKNIVQTVEHILKDWID